MIPTILLVMDEGNPRYTETLRQYRVRLTQRIFDEGWQVATASGVAQALAQLEAQKISLLVFDTTGYRGDRVAQLKLLRASTDLPVLVVVEGSDEHAELEMLENGAGRLPAPPGGRPAHHRARQGAAQAGARAAAQGAALRRPAPEPRGTRRRARRQGGGPLAAGIRPALLPGAQPQPGALPDADFKAARGIPATRETERTVDSHIKSLRAKLGWFGKHIITVRGVGYKFLWSASQERPA